MNEPRAGRGAVRVAGPVLAVATLAVLIAALHGNSLSFGLLLDDHAHYRQLRACDWSLRGLTEACRLELLGGTIDIWWLPNVTLRFFRPVAFGLMKLTYTLAAWRPLPLHIASLFWHFTVCVLLLLLLRRLGATRLQAWALAALFAIHPAHVATVQWIACQTELMVTAFLLAATLCFGRFRGWPGFGRGEKRSEPAGSAWALASAVLFALALGCRENALAFPLVVATLEPFAGRRGRRAALVIYAVFAAEILGYLAVRASLLGGFAVPPRPYVVTPEQPDFLRFVFDKALYYLAGEYLLVPCVPIGGLSYFQARPWLLYGLGGAAVLLVLLPLWRYRREPAAWLGPVWLLAYMLPLLPVFASPHHLYLPGIGWAVGALLLLRAALGQNASPAGAPATLTQRSRRGRARVFAVSLGLLAIGGVFGTWTYFSGLVLETGARAEACMADEIAAEAGALHDGDTLYLANMPVIAHYLRLAVEERTGLRNLRIVPLTWAPRLLGPVTPTELTQVNDHTIDVQVAGDHYFGGALGQLIREATGRDVPDVVDRRPDLGFAAHVLARDTEGVRDIRFEFTRPLSDAQLHLFWGSRARWACKVVFSQRGQAVESAAGVSPAGR